VPGSRGGSRTLTASDSRLVEDEAARLVQSQAWEKFSGGTVRLLLKAGSWYEATAQLMAQGEAHVLFLFPGDNNLASLQQRGSAEPPDGSMFAEFRGGQTSFRSISPAGWVPIDHFESRLLGLAFAAVTAAATTTEEQVRGELPLPDGVRGQFVAIPVPPDPNAGQLIMGMPRFDLYGEDECTLSLLNLEWSDYSGLRGRAEHRQSVGTLFENVGRSIPVFVISGPDADLAAVAARLREADPKGISFSEIEGALAVLAAGLQETYVLMQVDQQREAVLGWWYQVKSGGGAHAIVVADSDPEGTALSWDPARVIAVFEFGTQAPLESSG
jgi:hypothetical protein